jgi:hypothetical protein
MYLCICACKENVSDRSCNTFSIGMNVLQIITVKHFNGLHVHVVQLAALLSHALSRPKFCWLIKERKYSVATRQNARALTLQVNSTVFGCLDLANWLHEAENFETLTVSKLVKKGPTFYATRGFNAILTTARQWTPSEASWIHTTPLHYICQTIM